MSFDEKREKLIDFRHPVPENVETMALQLFRLYGGDAKPGSDSARQAPQSFPSHKFRAHG